MKNWLTNDEFRTPVICKMELMIPTVYDWKWLATVTVYFALGTAERLHSFGLPIILVVWTFYSVFSFNIHVGRHLVETYLSLWT